ncbi:MAG TPA: hypothetical protein VED46_07055 [Alphaproteobacteria bacterium]|nr:hypothetical protein [Alphaproteobacteria bacterium]
MDSSVSKHDPLQWSGPFWAALPLLFLAALATASIGLVLNTNGAFFYTLDDPYIHLALSERIARLHYGLNAGEFAAPSSSVLWPFLLAPFASYSWHHLVPLGINLAAQAGTLALIHQLMHRGTKGGAPGLAALLSILIAWCGGTFALIFTGMEHSLHLMLAVATVLGLIILIEERRLVGWLPALLVFAPLIRYEAGALTAIGLISVWSAGYRRPALLTAAACLLLLAAFSLFLVANGSPPFPGSVLAKLGEGMDPGSSIAASLIKTANFKLAQAEGRNLVLSLCAAALAGALVSSGRRLVALLALAFLLHFLFGLLTERYIVYLRTLLLIGAAYILAPHLHRLREWKGVAAAIALLLLASMPLLFEPGREFVRLPGRAQDIRLLQSQAHRFIVEEWKRPAAVNDLGQAAYRNPNYVLDLWGLGSEKARLARLAGGEGWAQPLLVNRHVKLALVFDSWLKRSIPGDWIRLGALKIDEAVVTHMKEELAFYADPRASGELVCLLARFAETLPHGVRFRAAATSAHSPLACHNLGDPRYSAPT